MEMHKSPLSLITVVVSCAITLSCGKKEDKDTDAAAGGSAGATNVTAEVAAGGLSVLPDISTMLKSDEAASTKLNLRSNSNAVNGTPPAVKEINSSNVEEYLTGDIDAFIASVEAKKAEALTANTKEAWDEVFSSVQVFRQAQTKCRVLEDTVRQISSIAEQTGSLCYFSKIGLKGAGILEYSAGEKVDEDKFFAPDEEKNVVRKVQMGAEESKLFLEGEGQGGGEGGEGGGGEGDEEKKNTIFFEIPKSTNGNYKLKMTMCKSDGTVKSQESIDVDAEKGVMTFQNANSGKWGTHNSKLVGYIKKDANGKLIFDTSKDRSVTLSNTNESSYGKNNFSSNFIVRGDQLISEFFTAGNNSFQGNNHNFSSKMVSATRFSGSKMSDIKVFEGAGAMSNKGSSVFDGQERSFSNDENVAFEFDTSKSPKFNTVTTGDFITLVKARLAKKDEAKSIMSGDAPKAPDVSGLANAAICSAKATSTYKIMASAKSLTNFMKVQTTCDGSRGIDKSGSDLCRSLSNSEQKIMNALFARQQSGKSN